jgi:hypothetical protein
MRHRATLSVIAVSGALYFGGVPQEAGAQTHIRDIRIETLRLPGSGQGEGVFVLVDPVKVYRIANMREDTRVGDAVWNRQRFEPLPQGITIEVYSVPCTGSLTLIKTYASKTEYSIRDRRLKGDISGCMGAYDHDPGYFIVVRVRSDGRSYFLPPKRVQRQVEDQSYYAEMWFEDRDDSIRLKFDIELF